MTQDSEVKLSEHHCWVGKKLQSLVWDVDSSSIVKRLTVFVDTCQWGHVGTCRSSL